MATSLLPYDSRVAWRMLFWSHDVDLKTTMDAAPYDKEDVGSFSGNENDATITVA